MDYLNKFNNRIEKFMYAVTKYQHCMENEFKEAINELDLKDGEILVNLAGGGLNLNNYITAKIDYIPFDFSPEWCKYDNYIKCISYENIPLANESVDKIIILAVLHHFTEEEREKIYKECFRILKKSGKLIVADVIKNSKQDIWLNTFVNKYNPLGHTGKFFTFEDADKIKLLDFNVEIKNKKYCWWFNNKNELVDFIKNLFYLEISDDELICNINNVLNLYENENKYYFEWELIYFICSPSN
jgi:SAM-dependent methyltransferase